MKKITLLFLSLLIITSCQNTNNTEQNSENSILETNITGNEISLNSSISITEAGSYDLFGEIKAGQILVDVGLDNEVTLNLNGISVLNENGSALYVKTGKVTLNLVEGTTNTFTDGKNYDTNAEANATIYSEQDLKISGSGNMIVNANYNDGINTKDDLKIKSGNIEISSVDDAIRGKDSVIIDGGNIVVNSTGHAIKSDNEKEGKGIVEVNNGNITINSTGDGLKAYHTLTINSGNINIENSEEGLEAEQIIINGGDISINSKDDGVNASSSDSTVKAIPFQSNNDLSLTINGGNLKVNSSGDGLDSNGNIFMNGGNVVIYGSTNGGNGALDYDGKFDITSGEFLAIGMSGMALGVSESSTQNGVLINLENTYKSGDKIIIKDSSGNVIYSGAGEKTFNSILYSSQKLETGKTYSYEIGNDSGNFTIESINTIVGKGGMMMFGRGGGGMGGMKGNRGQRPEMMDLNFEEMMSGMTEEQKAEFMEKRQEFEKRKKEFEGNM